MIRHHVPYLLIFAAIGALLLAVGNAQAALKFDDEFDGMGAPSSRWHVWTAGEHHFGEGCWSTANARQDGRGHLVLRGTRARWNACGTPYNAAQVSSRQTFRYGYYAARVKVSCKQGLGAWPSFWLVGGGGEADVMEGLKSPGYDQPRYHHAVLHGPMSDGRRWVSRRDVLSSEPLCRAYHVYGLRWLPGEMRFSLDGRRVMRVVEPRCDLCLWPYDDAWMQLRLDLQVGKSGGVPVPSEMPYRTLVDWVRIWE